MRNNGEAAKAKMLLAVCTLVPVLCFAFQDLGSEYGGMDWLTFDYAAWPFMLAPMAFLGLFIKYRELIRNPQRGAEFSQLIRLVPILFLIPNAIMVFGYSWLAAVPLIAILTILVGSWQLKKQASA